MPKRAEKHYSPKCGKEKFFAAKRRQMAKFAPELLRICEQGVSSGFKAWRDGWVLGGLETFEV
jgi:hypothetical protein